MTPELLEIISSCEEIANNPKFHIMYYLFTCCLRKMAKQANEVKPVKFTYLEESIIVLRRCAIVKIVQSTNSCRMVCWMRSSVSRSMAAVASSRTRTCVLRSKALARHTSCLWPTLKYQQQYPVILCPAEHCSR